MQAWGREYLTLVVGVKHIRLPCEQFSAFQCLHGTDLGPTRPRNCVISSEVPRSQDTETSGLVRLVRRGESAFKRDRVPRARCVARSMCA